MYNENNFSHIKIARKEDPLEKTERKHKFLKKI